MPTFYGISTAFTSFETNNNLHITTSTLSGTNKENVDLVSNPKMSWDLDLDINSANEAKKAMKKIFQTICEVVKLQRASSKEIKIPFILGHIDGFNMEDLFQKLERTLNPEYIIGESLTKLKKIRERFKDPLIIHARKFLNDPPLSQAPPRALALYKYLQTEVKPSADEGSETSLRILRIAAKDFARKLGQLIQRGASIDPKFILVLSPLTGIFDWFDLREVFNNQLKETLGITSNIVVKRPDDPRSRYYYDVAKAFILDEMDLHASRNAKDSLTSETALAGAGPDFRGL